MEIIYLPSFIRQYSRLESALQDEIVEKIELFKNSKHHRQLKVHKLKGRLKGRYSFSVNYQTRIIFIYTSKWKVAFLTVGDHDVYKE